MPKYSVSVNRLIDAENEEVAIKSFRAVQNSLPVTCFKYADDSYPFDGGAICQDLVAINANKLNELISQKFKSGNCVDVERIIITRQELDELGV